MSVGVIVRDASVVTARPVVPGPILEPVPPDALTAGSDLNVTTVGGPSHGTEIDSGSSLNKAQGGSPWPGIIDGAIKFFNSWRKNAFRQISNHNVAGNYGEETSQANFGFRAQEFPISTGSVAGMPASNVRGFRPEWNNLVPIVYGLRVVNPVGSGNASGYQVQPAKVVSQFTEPAQFTPSGTASLAMKGEVLQ